MLGAAKIRSTVGRMQSSSHDTVMVAVVDENVVGKLGNDYQSIFGW